MLLCGFFQNSDMTIAKGNAQVINVYNLAVFQYTEG